MMAVKCVNKSRRGHSGRMVITRTRQSGRYLSLYLKYWSVLGKTILKDEFLLKKQCCQWNRPSPHPLLANDSKAIFHQVNPFARLPQMVVQGVCTRIAR